MSVWPCFRTRINLVLPISRDAHPYGRYVHFHRRSVDVVCVDFPILMVFFFVTDISHPYGVFFRHRQILSVTTQKTRHRQNLSVSIFLATSTDGLWMSKRKSP